MADITSTTRASTGTVQVDVTLTSGTVIADPVAYVTISANSALILAGAGLDATLPFVGATLQSSTVVGGIYTYELISVYGDVPSTVTTHTHDHTTTAMPWGQTYRDGVELVVDSALGPPIISYTDDTTVDYLRIKTDTATTPRDLFWVKQGSVIRIGAHTEYYLDATYDLGTPDAGVTLRRPRDVRLSRDIYAGRNAIITGYGSYSSYVLGTHHRFTGQATNPDNTAGTRHVYVRSTDDTLRYWNGSSDLAISPAGASGDTVGQYTCAAGVAIGEVVVCSGVDTVVEANATTLVGGPVAGIVVNKPDATTANVKYLGETGAIFAGALTPGNEYFLARTAGGITDSLAGFTTGDTQVSLGFAKNTNTLVTRIGESFVW